MFWDPLLFDTYRPINIANIFMMTYGQSLAPSITLNPIIGARMGFWFSRFAVPIVRRQNKEDCQILKFRYLCSNIENNSDAHLRFSFFGGERSLGLCGTDSEEAGASGTLLSASSSQVGTNVGEKVGITITSSTPVSLLKTICWPKRCSLLC